MIDILLLVSFVICLFLFLRNSRRNRQHHLFDFWRKEESKSKPSIAINLERTINSPAIAVAQTLIEEDEYEKYFGVVLSNKSPEEVSKLKAEVILREARNVEIKRTLASVDQRAAERRKSPPVDSITFDANDSVRNEKIQLACQALHDSNAHFEVCDNPNESNIRILDTPIENNYILIDLHFASFRKWYPGTFAAFAKDKHAQRRAEMKLRHFFSKIGNDFPIEEISALRFEKGSLKATIALPAQLVTCYKTIFEAMDGKLKSKLKKISSLVPSNLLKNQSKDEIEMMEALYSYVRFKLDEVFPSQKATFVGRYVSVQTILKLSPQDFDSRGDFNFPFSDGDVSRRGNMEYCQPNSRWSRLGLRVLDLYPDGNEWIGMWNRPNEWAVGFHGTGGIHHNDQSTAAMQSIMASRQFSRGSVNVYGGEAAENRSDPTPDPGIYFAKNVEDCYFQTIESNGRKYDVAFQCRLHPDYVWVANEGRYLIVDAPHHVRPYGLLIREHDQE